MNGCSPQDRPQARSGPVSARIYVVLAAGLAVALLASFVLVEWLDVPLLSGAAPLPVVPGPAAAALSTGLLVADVVLPVPASIVMTGNGAVFGPVIGSAVSVLGGTGGTLLAVAAGRRGQAALGRRAGARGEELAARLVLRYGAVALVLTRPVPVLSEVTAVMAGTTGLTLRRAAWAGALGNVLPSVVCASAGAGLLRLHPMTLLAVTAPVAGTWVVAIVLRHGRSADGATSDPALTDGGR